MNLGFRDDHQGAEIIRDDFATLACSIVCESEKLIALGDEVAEACTEETLKRVYIIIMDIAYQIILTPCKTVGSTTRESSEN